VVVDTEALEVQELLAKATLEATLQVPVTEDLVVVEVLAGLV
tara:strand:- start:425 stop:550 length:126 start_codon:yes stop_codon:yes gene_type:complete